MTFNILSRVGSPKKATTLKDKVIARQDKLFVPEWSNFVTCTPYYDHFIYESNEPEQSAYMCTCGAIAVVVPPGPKGMFVCHHHVTYGFHATSMVNKKDVEKGDVKILKGRKWA